MRTSDLIQISDYEWEIPRSHRPDMRVPVRLFASRELLDQIMDDKSLDQAVNATTLPGVVGSVIVMPDMHQGYGFPIGGVAATEHPHGVISPGAIGYDINCGVRLLASSLELAEGRSGLDSLADRLNAYCPSGVGKSGALSVTTADLDRLLRDGSAWALKHGYATESDLERTEDRGRLEGAMPDRVSDRAKARGRPQVGSLGAGNHFLEVDVIDEIFDAQKASTFGLQTGCLAIQIHCGSRGLGHQVCTDYVQQFQTAARKYAIQLPDRELVCAPMDSPEGQSYLGAMRAAANFAFANRQVLAHFARRAFEDTYRSQSDRWHLVQVYDVGHNMGKLEQHEVDGRPMRVCVHRKGATRAFGPGSPGLPSDFQRTGQPVLVPGSMGTASWILAGSEGSMLRSLGSTCHGAGRVWSRSRAKKEVRGDALRRQLEARGLVIRAGSLPGLAEEAPAAYKDVDAVVETVVRAGIAVKVARLRPVAVIKG
jgi:tRNA-splicing ligase RtcB